MTEIFRSIPSFKLIKIDQDVPVYHRHVDLVQKTWKNRQKAHFSDFSITKFSYLVSYQDGPKCTKWPTWPLVVCGVCRAYVMFISNTWSVRQLTFKWSCSQFLLNFGNLENTVEPVYFFFHNLSEKKRTKLFFRYRENVKRKGGNSAGGRACCFKTFAKCPHITKFFDFLIFQKFLSLRQEKKKLTGQKLGQIPENMQNSGWTSVTSRA